MDFKLLATKASIITVTRPNLVDLQKAVRRILNKLENFVIADVEYTMDGTKDNKTYSAIIMGAIPEGYIDLNADDTGGEDVEPVVNPPDNPPDNPEPTPGESEDKLKELEDKQRENEETIQEMKDSIAEIMAYIESLKAKENENG